MSQVIDFVVADVRASTPAVIRIADVICLAGECADPWRRAGDMLARWPGSLVAVVCADDRGCVVAARGQPPVLLRIPADQILGCAAVAYWWIVSGRPLALLAGGHVAAVPGGSGSSPSSDASSRRTSSASGAAVASNPARASER